MIAGVDRTGPTFRPDIDGLRAVAILAVVLFHAGVPGLPGGFVGVDVFFVISGFLITRKLLADAESDHGVHLAGFWAKRARRLMPGLALMVVVTLGLSLVAESPMRWMTTAKEGVWSSLYVSNLFYSREAADYFAGGVGESPFLHTWSLAVEEQFYIVWPLLFIAVAAAVGRRTRRSRPAFVASFAGLAAISFGASLVLTASEQPVLRAFSFYGLPTRAWEFAAAGLLAAVPPLEVLRRPWLQRTFWIAGAALLAVAITQFRGGVPYPGWRAVVPVAGTMLLITAGTSPSAGIAYRSLTSAPLQGLGRLSYSWYLWHWPLMVLAVSYFNQDAVWFKLTIVAASLPVALLAFRSVEQRVRFLPVLTSSNRRTFLVGASVTALAVLTSAGLFLAGDVATDKSPYKDLVAAAEDTGTPCEEVEDEATGERLCIAGDRGSDRTVMLIGDSHADHWQATLGTAAESLGLRLVVRSLSNCPGIPVRAAISVENPDQSNVLCEEYQAETDRLIEMLQPDAVILAHARIRDRLLDNQGELVRPGGHGEVWSDALERRVASLRTQGIGVGVIDFSPQFDADVLGCLADSDLSASCDPPRADALSDELGLRSAQSDTLAALEVPSYQPSAVICGESECRLMIDGVLVFRDDSGHLTTTFTDTQSDRLQALISAAASEPGRTADRE